MSIAAIRHMQPVLVAVIEDDRNMAMLLAYNLERVGFTVTVIGSGAEAVEQVIAAAPDLIVLDWELPVLSGIEVLRQINKRLTTKRIPAIMLTGRTSLEDRERALATGADVYLSKPFAMPKLLEHAMRLVSERGAHSGGASQSDGPGVAEPASEPA